MTAKRGLVVKKKFDSAHFLDNYAGNCANVHGHTYNVEFYLNFRDAELNSLNMLLDFKILGGILDKVIKRYDHQLLNGLEPYGRRIAANQTERVQDLFYVEKNPTAEFMAEIIFKETNDALDEYFNKKCNLVEKIVIWETDKYAATYELENS